MNYRASQIARVTLDETRIIGSGETITVFGIIVANNCSSSVCVDFQSISGTDTFTITSKECDSKIMHIEFIADGGLQIEAVGGVGDASAVIVSVFYSQGSS